MIQIQGREQFRSAAERAGKEHMHVRRYEQNVYEVTNRAKGRAYLVRFVRLGRHVFGKCSCEAGTPSTERRPMVCKHLFAAVIFHNAVAAMRRGH
jgi:hypothetical protein